MRSPGDILEEAYAQVLAGANPDTILSPQQKEWVRVIARQAELQKAVMTLMISVKKIITPEQDIRLHKVEMAGGYSGRSFDTTFVTPYRYSDE